MSNNNLPTVNKEHIQVPSAPGSKVAHTINMTGEKNSYINNIEKVDKIENRVFVIQNGKIIEHPFDTNRPTCHDYYSLIVLGEYTDLKCCEGNVLMPKERCLTDGPYRDEINERLCHLTAENIEELKQYPALILKENTQLRGKTDPEQIVLYASIKDIRVQDDGVMIYYSMISLIKQNDINDLERELGLMHKSAKRELNRIHWVIKEIDLSKVLYDAQLIGKYW